MYSVAIFFFVSTLLGVLIIYKAAPKYFHVSDAITVLPVSVMLSVLFAMILASIGNHIYDESDWREHSESKTIYSVFNESSTSGSFFIGIGEFGSDRYYYYYHKTKDGLTRKKIKNDSGSRVYIKEGSDGTPKLTKKYYTFDSNWIFTIDDPPTKYIFHVPEGSVYNGIKMK